MSQSRPRHVADPGEEGRTYVGRHLAPQRTATGGLIAAFVLATVVLVTLTVVGLNVADSARTDQAGGRPSGEPSSSLLVTRGFVRGGVEQWRAFPGTFLTKGRLGEPIARYAHVQRDPTTTAVTDPSTGAAMVGIASRVLSSTHRGTPVRATVRVRGSSPGLRVVVRLSEQVGGSRVWGGEGRLLLLDTTWHEVAASHRARRDGASIDLEVWVSGLGQDEALYLDRAEVTSP